MDEFKKHLKTVALYKFWILSGVVLLASVGVFAMTMMSLSETISARTKKIDSTYASLNTVSGTVGTHPNATSHAEMDKIYQSLEADVQKAWKHQYDYQVPLLVWPKGAFSQDSTREIFANLRPIEKFVNFPVNESEPPINRITVTDRRVYRDYIGPEFEKVSQIIGSKWKAKLGGASSATGGVSMGGMPGLSGGTPGMTALPPESDDLVRWSESSQQTLLNHVVPWYNAPEPPSVLEIYYTQEDMWLLTSIMDIIKKTNTGAVENFQTVVREVEWIRMGRLANRDAGALNADPAAGGGGGYGQGGPPAGYGSGMSGMGSMGGSYGVSGPQGKGGLTAAAKPQTPDPAEGRYITFVAGQEFQARKASDLRASIKNITPGNAVDAIAKRVPIRMRLKIDPSRLHRLISECGNARMMLEVYQVRFNTAAAEEGSGGAAGGGGGGEGGGGGGGPGKKGGLGMGPMGGMGGGMGGGEGSAGAASAAAEPSETETSVEIFGLIYLYNPVNIGTLGSDKITAKVEGDAANKAASTPAAAGTPAASAPTDAAAPVAEPVKGETPKAETGVPPAAETKPATEAEKPSAPGEESAASPTEGGAPVPATPSEPAAEPAESGVKADEPAPVPETPDDGKPTEGSEPN